MKIHGQVIGQENLKPELDGRHTMVADEIDWKEGTSFIHPTLTGNITLTDSNLPQGVKTKPISVELDGDFTITVPAYWVFKGGTYDGINGCSIILDCINGTVSSEVVHYKFTPNVV
jgi:hypothetical protein